MKNRILKAIVATGLGVGLTLASGCLEKIDGVLCAVSPDSSACSNRINIDVPDIGDFF